MKSSPMASIVVSPSCMSDAKKKYAAERCRHSANCSKGSTCSKTDSENCVSAVDLVYQESLGRFLDATDDPFACLTTLSTPPSQSATSSLSPSTAAATKSSRIIDGYVLGGN